MALVVINGTMSSQRCHCERHRCRGSGHKAPGKCTTRKVEAAKDQLAACEQEFIEVRRAATDNAVKGKHFLSQRELQDCIDKIRLPNALSHITEFPYVAVQYPRPGWGILTPPPVERQSKDGDM